MRIVDSMPFAPMLIGPHHQESYRRSYASAAEGEVTVDESWCLIRESDHEIVVTAYDHLAGFLKSSLNVDLSADRTDRAIRLVLDDTLDGDTETHRLRVGETGIEIAGVDVFGVLQGVFRLEALMKERGGPFVPSGEQIRKPLFRNRVHRSALSPFYLEELTGLDGPPFDVRSWRAMQYPAYIEEDAGPDVFYHDNHLLRFAEHGFNGIWVRACLRHFAKQSAFPEFGEHSDAILGKLRALCRRANRQGMRVFLYMQEPLGFHESDPFWEKYPHIKGIVTPHAPIYTMCTANQEVLAYMREGSQYMFEHCPELAGILLISASEFPSHCYCHARRSDDPQERQKAIAEGKLCPRCEPRTPQEVIAEVITSIRDGVKAANPSAEVIAWNWSWSFFEEDPQIGVLERLPEDVIVMGDYERGTQTKALDFDYLNDEYSIKVIGPSPRFQGVADFQASRNMPVYAKLQIGTTHEIPNVPYLPTLQKIAKKYIGLPAAGVSGMMTCWNFGNMLSLGTETANEFSWDPQEQDPDKGVWRVAARNFGSRAADLVTQGWARISEAQDDFPGSIPVMYYGPISRAPAFHFEFDTIDQDFPRSWLLDDQTRGDRLERWSSPFGPAKVAECFRAVVAKWGEGVALMRQAISLTEGDDRVRLERETGPAEMCRLQLLCSANLIEFLLARNALLDATDAQEKSAQLDTMERLCRAELEDAAAAIPLCEADSRLGWHGEAYGYMITPELIEEKLAGLRQILEARIPAERAKLGG